MEGKPTAHLPPFWKWCVQDDHTQIGLVPSSVTKGPKASTRKFCPERTSALTSYLHTCSLEIALPLPSLRRPAFPDIVPGHSGRVSHWGYKLAPLTWVSSHQTMRCSTSSSGQTYSPRPGVFSLWRWLLNSQDLKYISRVRLISIPKWNINMLSQSHISRILYPFKVLLHNHHIWSAQYSNTGREVSYKEAQVFEHEAGLSA